MWRSYFQVFFRNLAQQKTIATINILGLALGLCAFLVIGVYVRDEYSYESRWQHADRIVRLVNILTFADTAATIANVTELAGPRLKDYFPDAIEAAARVTPVAGQVRAGNETFEQILAHADRELLDIFDFEIVEGSLQQAMTAPNRVVLHEDSARQFFGGEAAVGKLLTWDLTDAGGETTYEVAAVYRLPPGKGKLEFYNFSLLNENSGAATQAAEDWLGGTHSFFLLREGVDPAALAPRLDDFVNQQVTFPAPEGGTTTDAFQYRFQEIRDIYFNPNIDEEGGSQASVNTFGIIAALVLLIGWSNFVILALARSVERQREVGIRKTAGATGGYLFTQFVGEALLLAFIALVVALALLEVALPVFAVLMQTTLSIDVTEGSALLSLAVLLLVTGSVGGIYPALVLARQKPELVLKPGAQSGAMGTGVLRKLLVSFQFLIATMLIIATLVLYLQLSFIWQRDPGFETRNVVTLALQDVMNPGEVAVLRDNITDIPGVEQVALASHEAATPGNLGLVNMRQNADSNSVETTVYQVDYAFVTIYAMDLLAGRFYDAALDRDSQTAVAALPNPRLNIRSYGRIVLNETAIRALGFTNPAEAVGTVIEEARRGPEGNVVYDAAEIIGVVADNQFGSLRTAPGSEAYNLQSLASWYLTVKVAPSAMPGIAADLQRLWRELRPFVQPEISFADSRVQQAFARELDEGRLLMGFAALAIIVACMGLYGLVSFEGRRRTKEISIRSVLGGEFISILNLFLAQFARPVCWTNALAWPLALWFMLRWLERFPYRIENWVLLPVCVVAGLLVMSIVALTVGMTVAKAVEVKPVLALRYE